MKRETRRDKSKVQKEPEKQPQKQPEDEEAFSLYKLLEVDRKATTDEIKQSYKKLALKTHPDKNQDDPTAKQKFAKIRQAYEILIDKDRRRQYDETGRLNGQNDLSSFEDIYNFYRKKFRKISKQDIIDFQKKYVGGEMEQEDLLNFYKQFDGDVTKLLEHIPYSTNNDVDRFLKFFDEQIEKGSIKTSKKYGKTRTNIQLMPEKKKKEKPTKIAPEKAEKSRPKPLKRKL